MSLTGAGRPSSRFENPVPVMSLDSARRIFSLGNETEGHPVIIESISGPRSRPVVIFSTASFDSLSNEQEGHPVTIESFEDSSYPLA